MTAQQTLTDRIVEAERDIDRIDKEVTGIQMLIKILMWEVPILLTIISLFIKFWG